MPTKFGSFQYKTLSDIDVTKKRVFYRVDLNVPLQDGRITDDTRIQAILPTLEEMMEKKALIVMASHLGRPKGKPNEKYSMIPVGQKLAELLKATVIVPDDCTGSGVTKLIQDQDSSTIILLENLRFHAEEEANDAKFAQALKGQTEIFITDAFGALHRAHASTSELPRLYEQKGIGRLVEKELAFLTPLLEEPHRPYAVLLGGAKVTDKLKVIENLMKKVNCIFFGGAMVFTFLKAMGHKVGNSLVDKEMLYRVETIMEEARKKNIEMIFPKDFAIGKSIEAPGDFQVTKDLAIPDGYMGLDIGPKSIAYFEERLKEFRTIFWNGPMGLFEKPPYDKGTMSIAKALGSMDSIRVLGGGDSAAAAAQAGVSYQMSHVSTGGGATLEFLEGQSLPGLRAVAV